MALSTISSTDKRYVDKLSLALSLHDDHDPRIEKEVELMIEQFFRIFAPVNHLLIIRIGLKRMEYFDFKRRQVELLNMNQDIYKYDKRNRENKV